MFDLSSKTQPDGSFEVKEAGQLLDGDGTVKRNLQQRHVSMIAIGGTIGTGLFLGIGNALEKGGPLGLLLGYIVVGTVIYCMQVALGEMVTMIPVSGSLTHYPTRFVDPALGFAVGWNYWYSYVICLPAEVTAAAIVVNYWKNPLTEVAWITIFFLTSGAINFFGVRWYGEKVVCLLAAVKVLAIVLLIVIGLVLDLGGGTNHEMVGFKYWNNPGPFRNLRGVPGSLGKFLSFWRASYSFLGTEMVAIAAGEASNPRKTVPRAISSVFYRILFFYVFGALVVGMLVPSDDPRLLGATGDASSSPFVIAINETGIKILPDLINAFILVSAYSAASSQVYGGSRILYGLANDNMAPRLFKKCTKGGLPLAATILSVLPGFLAYMNCSQKAGTLFNWLSNLSATAGLITWWTVCLSYIQFHKALKAQGFDRNSLPFKAPGQPYMTYYAIVMFTIIILMNGFEVFLPGRWAIGDFLAAYITLPIFFTSYIIWKTLKRTKFVQIEYLDLVTGQKEFKELDEPNDIGEEKSKNIARKILNVVSGSVP
ncbi:hypothetical protein CROQUDRAFT_44027 [Cronartium quercuum f. sp. fusiforme G11]|uniref:Amino acid permease/ SLC12A domain-containing protein n=1 Tax=Cronartium quercuum f. sp. fusiforme G11 TaxID=708437 RepID=A0A9P6TCE3_9BASI|nr:hypothetical protein CROQUDRAFT_44027 [Cronartium quercuum f. sp. fusiforme G11]